MYKFHLSIMAFPLKFIVHEKLSKASLTYRHCMKIVLSLALGSWILLPITQSLPLHNNGTDVSNVDALHRLLEVFGMNHPGRRDHHHFPPQYMLDLYNAIADSSGIARTQHPYKANIVRSFLDRDVRHQQKFYFNFTSSIPVHERVLQAELHLYKTKAREFDSKGKAMSHLFEVRIYQIMSVNSNFTEEDNKLLDVRKINAHGNGWEVFYVKAAVVDWLRTPDENYGFFIIVRNMVGKQAHFELFKTTKRHRHNVNKQSILVVFTDDGRQQKSLDVNVKREDLKSSKRGQVPLGGSANPELQSNSTNREDEKENLDPPLNRNERAVAEPREPANNGCTRHELHVDFEKIGWSSWIISPKWYNAYFCRGECDFPLGQNQRPTNHATVQSIVHELNLHPELGTPCCVPSKLYSINLLYFDEYENVILKQYDDMVAASCGCH